MMRIRMSVTMFAVHIVGARIKGIEEQSLAYRYREA